MWHFGFFTYMAEYWFNLWSHHRCCTNSSWGGIVALYLIGSPAHGAGVISNGGSVGIGAGGVTNLEDAGAACGEACGAPTTGCTSQPCSFYFRHLTYLSHSKNRT